jgi:hypothetical protein
MGVNQLLLLDLSTEMRSRTRRGVDQSLHTLQEIDPRVGVILSRWRRISWRETLRLAQGDGC